MESEHIRVRDINENFDRIDDILEDYLFRIGVSGKNALRFSLLTEEAARLAKSIVSESEGIEIWFEGDARVSNIYLKANCKMSANQKEEFLSASTTGENMAKKTFFDELRGVFVKQEKPTWSLAEYEAELRMRREKDQYSEEAWGDLERSVLANLADDISVGIKDDIVLMVIQKDFTESLSKIGASKPKITTQQIFFINDDKAIESALEKVDANVKELKLAPKDELHVKLLFEEAIGMARAISGEFTAMIWAEGYKKQCAIKLLLKTQIDGPKKTEFLSVASDRKNASAVGTMAKIKDVIETGLLNYEWVMKLNQEYNGGPIGYGAMGTYMMAGPIIDSPLNTGFMWSLDNYKKELDDMDANNAKEEAWDELEKSIVASLAKDVVVGVKNKTVNMTIVYDEKEGQ